MSHDWLEWVREAQAIAQTGLAFSPPGYDRDRYLALQALAARMMAALGDGDPALIAALFAAETGYATPKVDVRGAVFHDGRLMLVREAADQHSWTLPGGWADVNLSPAENVAKEVLEESGFAVRVDRLVAVLDRTRAGHPPQPFHAYKLFFLCTITGGAATPSAETSEIGFFAEHELPSDLSHDRTLPAQLHRMFRHHEAPLGTDFN
jgi:ADP-ribose pyrophosphatase YjhB (NUDIX family)